MANSITMDAPPTDWLPTSLRFSRICLPSGDLDQSRRFFVDVLGGIPVEEPGRLRVRFANFDLVAEAQQGGATAADREYPHYAFTIPADLFVPIKRRLEDFGIPTHDPWTRTNETHAIMYFRDPSDNQFELFTPEGDIGMPLRLGDRAGGDYVIPFSSLVYDRINDRRADATLAVDGMPIEFNHMTIPCRDFDECRRFHAMVFGGEVTLRIPNHVTITVGGFDVGYGGPADAQWPWPAPEMRNPRYVFTLAPDEFPLMVARLGQFGVPVSPPFTANDKDTSVYFRDPASNLWELVCEDHLLTDMGPLAGEAAITLDGLNYGRWNDPETGAA